MSCYKPISTKLCSSISKISENNLFKRVNQNSITTASCQFLFIIPDSIANHREAQSEIQYHSKDKTV